MVGPSVAWESYKKGLGDPQRDHRSQRKVMIAEPSELAKITGVAL